MGKSKKGADDAQNLAESLMEREAALYGGASRIGVLGGTFDPIHYGHLALGEAAREGLGLDVVVFMPAGSPAFKQSVLVSPGEDRYTMTALAAASDPRFHVSRLELDRPGVTYSVDTAQALRALCPSAQIYFITGADAFCDILKWKKAPELLRAVGFAVAKRPGTGSKRLDDTVREVRKTYKTEVVLLDMPAVDTSSRLIRGILGRGGSARYLLPDQVLSYINERGLYAWQASLPPQSLMERLRKTQSEKRFAHTLDVAEEARRLAGIHGVSVERAYLAGILHDAAKGFTDARMLEKAKEYGLRLDDMMTRKPSLAHAAVGAEMARRDFGVSDEDIQNAIRYHTTGRPGMSRLEKIIFLADYIEPSRNQEGVEAVRASAEYDLDAAVLLTLEGKIAYNIQKEVHPLSRLALDYLTYHYHAENSPEDV